MSGLSTSNETSTPSAPPSGSRRLYPTALGWVDMDSAGNTYLLGAVSVSGGVTGRVIFGGSGTAFAADASLFWDNTNKRLSIGSGSSPTYPLDVTGSVRVTDGLNIGSASGAGTGQAVFSGNVSIGGTSAPNSYQRLLITGTVTAASTLAIAEYVAPTLLASANNDTLYGLYVNPTYDDNGKTGVVHRAIYSPGTGTIVLGGGLNVGSATGATNAGMIYATTSYVASAQVYYLSNTATNTAASAIFPSNLQAEFDVTNSAGATYGSEFLGFNLFLKYRGAATINAVNLRDVVGITANVFDYNSGTIPYMVGMSADMRLLTGAGTVTNLVQFHARNVIISAGSVTNKYSFKAESGAGAASIHDGLNVGSATGATSQGIVEIKTDAGASPSLRLLDGDVSHPFTSPALTPNLFGNLTAWAGAAGGLLIQSISDSDSTSFGVVARVGATTTTLPAIAWRVGKANGSGGTASLASTEIHTRWENTDGTSIIATMYGNGTIITSGYIDAIFTDSAAGTITNGIVYRHSTSGTPVAGFGTSLFAIADTNGGDNRTMFYVPSVWNDATDGTRKAQTDFYIYDTSARLAFSMSASGTAAQLGFFGTAPIAKPTVTGSRGGNAALASLLTALANLGLLVNSSS